MSLKGTFMVDEFISHSPYETMRVAEEMVRRYGKTTYALYGGLGSGKTVFVKGMAVACGVEPNTVVSPTFKILNIYRGEKELYHIDAYRLSDADELFYAVGEISGMCDGLVAVEWADRVEGALPPERVDIEIQHILPNQRRILVRTVELQ